jgi:hypothetical protein
MQRSKARATIPIPGVFWLSLMTLLQVTVIISRNMLSSFCSVPARRAKGREHWRWLFILVQRFPLRSRRGPHCCTCNRSTHNRKAPNHYTRSLYTNIHHYADNTLCRYYNSHHTYMELSYYTCAHERNNTQPLEGNSSSNRLWDSCLLRSSGHTQWMRDQAQSPLLLLC